jgi:hypothetical protein
MTEKEPREHGLIFGRGDELGDDVEEPPMGHIPVVPLYGPTAVPFGDPPPEKVDLVGEVPWELRDEPPSGPVIH